MASPRSESGVTAAADPIAGSPVYPLGSRVNRARVISRSAAATSLEVARRVRHPRLYLCARRHPRPGPRLRRTPCAARDVDFEVLYASKAAPFTAVLPGLPRGGPERRRRLGRRAHTWRSAAGFEPGRIYMHGNNKSEPTSCGIALRLAGSAASVLDSLDEIARCDAPSRSRPGRPDPADPRGRALDPSLRSRPASSIRSSASGSRAGRPRRPRRGRRLRHLRPGRASTPTSAPRSSSSTPTRRRSSVMAELLPAA